VKLNLTVPNNNRVTTLLQPWQDEVGAAEIAEIARLADRLGFGRLTVGEHFAIPEAHVAVSGAHYMHATTALAYLAGNTRRIRLASNVSLVALQHPIVQAKQWAVLDWLSGGRADLVVGVGWLKGEFDALGVDFHARGHIVDEHIEAMQEVWTNETASYRGRFVAFEGVGSAPKPVSPSGIPLWFAGDVPATLRRVARWGVGWSPYLTRPADIPKCVDAIKSDPAYGGQTIDVFYNLANLRLDEGHTAKDDDHDFDTWNAQQLVDQIAWAQDLGITEVALPLPNLKGYQHYLDRLRWLAEEVMPRVG
jgi:probable F420-dependent oxidoreductase